MTNLKNLLAKKLLVIICIGFIYPIQAQNIDKFKESLFQCYPNSELSQKGRIELASMMENWSRSRTQKDYPVIPTVLHIVGEHTVSREQARELATDFIDGLNDAFSQSGIYESDTIGVDTGIRFCLARVAPDGSSSVGITTTKSYYHHHDMDLEFVRLMGIKQWDPDYYMNIWLVTRVDAEIVAFYDAREGWERYGAEGYASYPGMAVTYLGSDILAHEAGHYLGLLHTFYGGCENDDCTIDGDMVCDTPPDGAIKDSCGANSCNTDTLSNYSNGHFYEDVPDMGSNIMDYFNDECRNNFSAGQAERMHFILDTYRPNLTDTSFDRCNVPCALEKSFGFDFNRELIVPGDTLFFEATQIDGLEYSWFIEKIGQGPYSYFDHLPYNYDPQTNSLSNTKELTHVFLDEGKYRVYVKAVSPNDESCFVSDHRVLGVSCGLDARFVPNKRKIASKLPVDRFTDINSFSNRTVGEATSYEWNLRYLGPHRKLEPVDSVFTSETLDYLYPEPGWYNLSLTAFSDNCKNTSNTWELEVYDPTIDGIPTIRDSSYCYEEGLLINVDLYNDGYDTINIGTQMSIYGKPNEGNEEFLGTYELDKIVYGFESEEFQIDLKVDTKNYEEIHLVFNDTGSVNIPIFPPADSNVLSYKAIYPPSGILEMLYNNNKSNIEIKQFELESQDIVACEDEELYLSVEQDSVIWWSANEGLIGEIAEIEYLVDDLDTISVVAYDSGYCPARDTFHINVSVPNVLVADSIYIIVWGESIQLMASGTETYFWSPATGLSDRNSNSPIAIPTETTVYSVIGTDSAGCTDMKEVIVYVTEPAYMPTLFTPNHDGQNDLLRVYGLSDVDFVQYEIYNNDDKLVYQTNRSELFWNGKFQGQELPIGVYYWSVNGRYKYGREILINGKRRGVIHLARP